MTSSFSGFMWPLPPPTLNSDWSVCLAFRISWLVIEHYERVFGLICRLVISAIVSVLFVHDAFPENAVAQSQATNGPVAKVPGRIISHSAASSGLYIGSPSIAVLTNGDYVASHDFFGPNSQ